MRVGILAAAMAATVCTAAQPVLAAWRYAPVEMYHPTYWSTDIRRDGDQAEFSSIRLQGLSQADGILVWRKLVRIDCAWGVGRESWAAIGRPLGAPEKDSTPPKDWDRAKFFGDPQDPNSAAAFACSNPTGPYPSLAAAVKDGIGRFGYDVEAAYKVDTPPPPIISAYEEITETPPPFDPPGPLDLIWRAGDKAVFVSARSVKRQGKTVTAQAIWVAGVGRAKTDQVYLLRDFEVDCGSGAFAQSTRVSWPGVRVYIPSEPRPRKPVATPSDGPEARLLATVCEGRAALQQLKATGELGDFAAAPAN
ncbi:hypothetical protein [Caulobacter sp. LARHSG274]